MDHLIVRMSALQDSNTMDIYRFYMVLLIYCGWPYVLLMTSAIFGFVTDIDADAWRSNIPRIFRLSFSHIRVGDHGSNDRKIVMLPTDILSFVLLCVGYEPVEADGRCSEDGGKPKRGVNRARRRAAFSSMLSSRSFILRSFVAFTRKRFFSAGVVSDPRIGVPQTQSVPPAMNGWDLYKRERRKRVTLSQPPPPCRLRSVAMARMSSYRCGPIFPPGRYAWRKRRPTMTSYSMMARRGETASRCNFGFTRLCQPLGGLQRASWFPLHRW
ncbi:hypothetical protein C3747_37g2 [Trypanosoma cruzi]|uniref:Uncharacterized protein n=1 Tax=Trypanosoma cruzi TaxID=5693 RepID=A0A2V2X0B5_TRYCR|nr:hypothetical protein C3747_37g2 [Trypanosoma cruzi]